MLLPNHHYHYHHCRTVSHPADALEVQGVSGPEKTWNSSANLKAVCSKDIPDAPLPPGANGRLLNSRSAEAAVLTSFVKHAAQSNPAEDQRSSSVPLRERGPAPHPRCHSLLPRSHCLQCCSPFTSAMREVFCAFQFGRQGYYLDLQPSHA